VSVERRQNPRPQVLLVVDDNEPLRHLWSTWFSFWNFVVVEAHNGLEALRAARTVKPAAVVMDVAMPLMDGIDATRVLKGEQETADIPVVVVTAHASPRERLQAREAGCDSFVPKPCDPDTLLNEVRRVLRRKRPCEAAG